MVNRSRIIKDLITEKKDLIEIIKSAEMRMQKAPDGYIRISRHGKGFQFFHVTDPKNTNGKYIRESDNDLKKALLQKRYDKKAITAAQKQLNKIDSFLKSYDPDDIAAVYSSFNKAGKPFIDPYELPDKEFISEWTSFEYAPKAISDNTPEHFTRNGERVRSKSEVLIADALLFAGIPYRYECPLKLGHSIIHPDFTILKMPERKPVFWEHFGLIDDPEYRNDALSRIQQYEKNGLFEGEDTIFTFESYRKPLNLSYINMIIKHYFPQPMH